MSEDRTPDAEARSAVAAEPFLRVLKGNPDAIELAAVIALFAASAGDGAPTPTKTVGGWSSRAALLRSATLHGPGAWAASARQR